MKGQGLHRMMIHFRAWFSRLFAIGQPCFTHRSRLMVLQPTVTSQSGGTIDKEIEERIRKEKVAHNKALAAMLAEK